MKLNECMEQVYPLMERRLKTSDLKTLKECPYHELSRYHFGLGMWIRNTLLQEESVLCRAFERCNVFQKDDMSEFLIKSFYIYLQEKKGNGL